MALEIYTIASSSKGNCLLVRNENTTVLIDMGISFTSLKTALNYHKICIDTIDAILITHEHIDHISGLKSINKLNNIPVYCNKLTMGQIYRRLKCEIRHFDISESGFSIKDLDIQPFRIRHDAVYPLCYSIMDKSGKISVATDLGCMTAGVMNNLKGSDVILIESNHNEDMVRNGEYPKYVKDRILSNVGHLSNEACANAVLQLADSGTHSFILGHLSENNNTRRLAYSVTADMLIKNNIRVGADVELDVAASKAIYVSHSECGAKRRKII